MGKMILFVLKPMAGTVDSCTVSLSSCIGSCFLLFDQQPQMDSCYKLGEASVVWRKSFSSRFLLS